MAEEETPVNVDDISSEPLVENSVLSTDNPVMEEGTPETGGEDIKPKTPSAEDGGDGGDGDGVDDAENVPLIIPSRGTLPNSNTDWFTAYTILLVVSTEGNTGSKYLVCPKEFEEQIKAKTNRKLKVIFFIRLFL